MYLPQKIPGPKIVNYEKTNKNLLGQSMVEQPSVYPHIADPFYYARENVKRVLYYLVMVYRWNY